MENEAVCSNSTGQQQGLGGSRGYWCAPCSHKSQSTWTAMVQLVIQAISVTCSKVRAEPGGFNLYSESELRPPTLSLLSCYDPYLKKAPWPTTAIWSSDDCRTDGSYTIHDEHLKDLRWGQGAGSEGHRLTSPLGRIFCSSSLKAVPILLLTIGGSSPGSRGYSRGSFPVSSCKQKILLVIWNILQESTAQLCFWTVTIKWQVFINNTSSSASWQTYRREASPPSMSQDLTLRVGSFSLTYTWIQTFAACPG